MSSSKLKTAPLKAQTGKQIATVFEPSGYSTGQLRMPPSRRRKALYLRRFVVVAGVLAFCGGVAGALSLMGASAFLDTFNPDRKHALTASELAKGLVPLADRQTILVMGTDIAYADGKAMDGGPSRSDTMMLVGVDAAGEKLDVVSIPRDTRALIRGRWDKVNAALHQGGPKLAAQTVSDLVGVPVKHWALVNTTGLEKLIDVIGGVRLYVERDMKYTDHTAGLDIDIRRGWQTMGGSEAHKYVRFRHDELGDIGRVQRQQQFLRAALERVLMPDTLLKVPQMMTTVKANVQTNLSGPELVQLATWAVRLDRKDVHMVMLPGQFSGKEFAASYWLADPVAARQLGKRLSGREAAIATTSPPRNRVSLTVLNGTSSEGLGQTAARELREKGWTVRAVGDAPTRANHRTRVIAQTGHGEWVGTIGKDLGLSCDRVDASIGDILTDFTVIVGDDYAQEVGLAAKP